MSKKVREEAVFLTPTSKKLFSKIDFADTFSTTNLKNSVSEVALLIFTNESKWIKALFTLRNKIAKLFKLEHNLPDDYNTELKVGGYISFFKIYQLSENEIILGADDSHLNFRAIINNTLEKANNIKVTTLVEFNNTKGKVYMKIVAPFHRIVVKQMIKKAYLI